MYIALLVKQPWRSESFWLNCGILKWRCPQCGNEDGSTMDIAFRCCGYIGTSKNGGNQGRYGDIHDRVYHLDDKELNR